MDKPPESAAVQLAYRNLLRTITAHEGRRRQLVPKTHPYHDLVPQPVSMNGSRRKRDTDEDQEPLANLIPYEYSLEDEVIEAIERRRRAAAARTFVASLPPRMRQVVTLIYWDEMTQAEVARHLGISGAAVSKALKRAHDRGRVELAG